MPASTKHLLLTRFNVASPGREQAIRLRPGWLSGRFDLFRRYCLPSVASQTRTDFEWIIFFDDKTPKEYLTEIEKLQAVFPFRAEFTPLFQMKEIVPQILGSARNTDWLLTTRLDSDDILAVNYIERLRAVLVEPRHQVVNFLEGTVLAVDGPAPRLYSVCDKSNPFASLMEPMQTAVKTIWGEMHVDIEKIAPVLQIAGDPAWMQIVHGGNVSNRIKGGRVRIDNYGELFPYLRSIEMIELESDESIAIENKIIGPMRKTREKIRGVIKKLKVAIRRISWIPRNTSVH